MYLSTVIAILTDMIRCLVELQHDIGDALLHAVSIHNAQAVRTLCKNLSESVSYQCAILVLGEWAMVEYCQS